MNHLKSDNRRMWEENHLLLRALVAMVPEKFEGIIDDILKVEDLANNYYDLQLLLQLLERETLMNFVVIPKMALCLSPKVIEKICNKIFSRKGVEEDFVKLFYEYFFRVYVKRVYSWSSLHLLIKASKAYPEYFKTTIGAMFRDTEVPNNILLDYVRCLNQEDCTDLIITVWELLLTPEQFDHNLPVLCAIFKKCVVNDLIVRCVKTDLVLFNIHCARNQHYGRLLYLFIESLAHGFCVSVRVIRRLIYSHQTSFRWLCGLALQEYERMFLFPDLL